MVQQGNLYKQQSDDTSELNTDESLFITCLVPLELYCIKDDKHRLFGEIRNHRQLGTAGLSDLKIEKNKKKQFLKNESIMASIKNITLSIEYVLLEGGTIKEVKVQHIVNLTMIDDKIQTITY